MKKMLTWTVVGVVLLGMTSLANAALIQIGTASYAGNNYNLIYEGEMNGHGLVWLDYSMGNTNWGNAVSWTAGLNNEGMLTYSMNPGIEISWGGNWRLPQTLPVNGSTYNYSIGYDGSTDWGGNISAPGSVYPGSKESEMAHLFHTSLENKGYFDLTGNYPQSGYGLQFTGPFNSLIAQYYWSLSEYAPYMGSAWVFYFREGIQSPGSKNCPDFYALAVRSADVSTAPIPGAMVLLGSGLIGLIGFRRRRS